MSTTIVTSVTKHLRVDDLLALIRMHPSISKYAMTALALVVGKSIASLIRRRVAKHTVLEIDLDDKIREYPQKIQVFDHYHSLFELTDSIDFARSDAKVTALLVRVKSNFNLQIAQIQELRASVERFKSAGKLAVIYSESFGELSNSIKLYYLASAFSLIFVQQSGAVCLAGPSADVPFIRNTLNKLNVVPEISQRKAYKSAANLFTQENLTPEHREMMESLIASLYDQMIVGISAGRKLTEEVVRAKILQGIHSSTNALDGLVDGARYQDEVYRAVIDQLKITQSKANFLFWHKYRAKRGGKYSKKSKNVIALIYATGNIHRGTNQHNEFTNTPPSIGSDSLCAALRTATKDKKVKAIVLRVDSGGGSYVASDSIYHEVLAAKNAGKKIVVSMGDYAASGGYFISMAADYIFAEPGTLTGSIGVVFGKLITRGLWDKLGVSFDEVKLKMENDDGSGIYNDYFSSLHSYEKGAEYIKKREEVLDYIYEDFTKKVAFSRKLNRDQVETLAQGRVWTGKQAFERGLVDQLGGLEEAIHQAKTLANIPSTATPFVQVYPKPNWLQIIKTPKNRDEADATGITELGMSRVLDSMSLVANISSLFNTYAPSLSLLLSPSTLSTLPEAVQVYNNIM